jgi:hypothetical protein
MLTIRTPPEVCAAAHECVKHDACRGRFVGPLSSAIERIGHTLLVRAGCRPT